MSDDPVIPNALDDFQSSITIKLRTAVTAGKTTIDSLTLKEPTAAQIMEAAEFGGMKSTIFLLHKMSGQLPTVIEGLCARDFYECDRWLRNFLPGGRWIGEIG